eukprot:jgi/Psemu1/15984/gm1.15984_g
MSKTTATTAMEARGVCWLTLPDQTLNQTTDQLLNQMPDPMNSDQIKILSSNITGNNGSSKESPPAAINKTRRTPHQVLCAMAVEEATKECCDYACKEAEEEDLKQL